jgi:hypothetical protein
MKRALRIIFLGIFLFSFMGFVSANVELTNSVNAVYNLGEIVKLNIQVSADEDISDSFSVNLICGLKNIEVYKEFTSMLVGDVRNKEILIPLIDSFIDNARGDCSIEYSLGDKTGDLVDNFEISDVIILDLEINQAEFVPGENLAFQGNVQKKNGKDVSGTIEVVVKGVSQSDLTSSASVSGSSFSLELFVPSNFKSGEHIVEFYVYEKDAKGVISNKGNLLSNVLISQIPTNLEVLLDDDRIEPGTNLRGKTILRDQTGEKISAPAYIGIKNYLGEIVKKIEERTDVDFEYFIALNESPKEGVVSVYSEGLTQKVEFKILEKPLVDVQLVNNSLIVTNIGNVYYNQSVLVKIGEDNVSFNPDLGIGQVKKFILTAPKGEYEVIVEGVSEKVFLTGNAVDIKEAGVKKSGINPIFWIFIILVLLIAFFILYKQVARKRKFRRPIVNRDRERVMELREIKASKKNSEVAWVNPKVRAELSLSINGSKQDANVMCLNLGNYEEISNGGGNVSETLQRIIDIFESEKGFIYDNKENIFFILAPSRTRTFQNEMKLIELADKAQKILKEHNHKFNKKIQFGLSLNYGTIVTADTKNGLKFMSMGTFMTISKKIAMRSRGHILMSTEFKSRLKSDVKTEAKDLGNMTAHLLREVVDRTKSSTFLEGFVARHQRDMAKKQEVEKKNPSEEDSLADLRD